MHKHSVKYLLLIVAVMLLSGFTRPTSEVSLGGHLRSRSHKKVSGLKVFATGIEKNGMGKAVTDKNGDFVLDFDIGSEWKAISVYCVTAHKDTILLKRITKLKDDTPEMTFWIK